LLHQHVLASYRGVIHVRLGDSVAYELEHIGIRRKGEHHHDEPVYARCDVEAIVRMRQMLEKVTVEQGLALFLQTDGGIELSFGLTRHERTEEVDVSCGGFRVHQEVGARETEQCA